MNSIKIKKKFVVLKLFFITGVLLSSPESTEAKAPTTGYFGSEEISRPYTNFITPADYMYIYRLSAADLEKNPVRMDFADLLGKRKFKEAEKLLLEKNSSPYYMLNLILLYLYFDKPEFIDYFRAWQNPQNLETQVRLIEILDARRLRAAMSGLAEYWLNKPVKLYAAYKLNKYKKNYGEVLKGFYEWNSLKDQTDYEKSLYMKARQEWSAVRPVFKENLNKAGKAYTRQQILDMNATREMLTEYLLNLRSAKKWDDIINLVSEVQWLTDEEKESYLIRVETWKKIDIKEEKDNKKVRVKIKPLSKPKKTK